MKSRTARADAQRTAIKLRRLKKLPGDPRRVLDTRHDNAPAWTVMVDEVDRCAVVVYEDDPNTVASVGFEPGRWRGG